MHTPTRICPICGKEFTPGSPSALYCCDDCRREAMRTNWAKSKTKAREKIVEQRQPPKRRDTLIEKVRKASQSGKTYADLQREETARMYARVEI